MPRTKGSTGKAVEKDMVKDDDLFIDDVIEKNVDEKERIVVSDVGPVARSKSVRTEKIEPDALIPCRSIVQGYLNFKGKKSGTVYQWESVNDVTDVEYQDLKSAMLSRSVYITRPYFIVEDDEVLNLPEWKEVKRIYDSMYSKNDLADIFRIDSPDEMGRVLESLPSGVKQQIGSFAKELMERGVLDSVRKIRKIDEVLGTSLMLYVSGNN